MIPLLAGVAELTGVLAIGTPNTTAGQIAALLPGFLLIMAGLVTAGPWLTMAGARVMARRARRPALLLAARRLADNPRAGFRAISGLILALFVTSVAVGVITTISANRGTPSGGEAARDTLVGFQDYSPVPHPVDRVPGAVLGDLRSIHGVQGVTLIHTNPLGTVISARQIGMPSSFGGTIPAGLVSCAELSRTPVLGRCPAGAQAAAILPPHTGPQARSAIVWSAAAVSAQRLQRLPVQSIAVSTDGSTAAIERARTVLDVAYPDQVPPATMSESAAMNDLRGWQQLADVVVIVTLVIAGCTLAASVAAGLSERKRPFSLLRLTGAPLGVLRRVVATETAVPLLAVAVVSTGTGFLAAELFLSAQMDYTLRPPGAGYYGIVVAGLAASLAIVASTMPLLTRITGPETARNE
ncbi:MAG TPA: FtsX-like permease family protein [Streptosporangiaceae bacterium]